MKRMRRGYKPHRVSLSTKRDGVCNPVAYVLCEFTSSNTAQNLTDGITNPVMLCGYYARALNGLGAYFKTFPFIASLMRTVAHHCQSAAGLVGFGARKVPSGIKVPGVCY